ncbi:MAG: polyketide synthase, partial [Clostridium sp.]|nr:polyketide synthase [Clostridium sp.]
IDTACSSSLVAISRAVELLKNGDCEYAIAGGINLMLSPTLHQSFEKAGMLSKKGHCSTFDKDADGYVRGEGGGVVLLKPLDKAIRDKDNIYAVIKGTSVNHGGRANFITAPNPDAQAELITSCYEKAGIDFSTIKYIETHGTGTSLGDAVEIAGLNKAYKNSLSKHNKVYGEDSKCLIGSVKTNIGHLEAASGMASLIKSILILKNEEIVPHLNVKEINPNLNLEKSHFTIVNKLTSWKAHYETPRRIGISTFGFGGTNAHLILED